MDTYVEAGVHCGGCIQIPDDALKSTSGREIGEERRMLPMGETGHYKILPVIGDFFDTLPLGWRSI